MENLTDHWIRIRSDIWRTSDAIENVELKSQLRKARQAFGGLSSKYKQLKSRCDGLAVQLEYAKAEDPMARSIDQARHHAAQQTIRDLKRSNESLQKLLNGYRGTR